MKFETVTRFPRLAKYKFQEDFLADQRGNKILASTGAYKTDQGEIAKFECVRIATERVRNLSLSKSYLDIAGYKNFREAVTRFVFNNNYLHLRDRVITVHTPGGTAALRLGADFIKSEWPDISIWVSDPTWGNHLRIFKTAGLIIKQFPYFDAAQRRFKIDDYLASINNIPDGDVIFLQASTHNPTCIDPTPDEWRQIAQLCAEKELLPFFDVAFFGFSDGIRDDLEGLMVFCESNPDVIIAFSFSKSFALYNDRIGALSILGSSTDAARNVYSNIRYLIRVNYSNPPLDGAAVVTEILCNPRLVAIWEEELILIRKRIHRCRLKLMNGFYAARVTKDLSYLLREKGLFTNLDISQEEIDKLRKVKALYIANTKRINVTAMTDFQIDRFCSIVGPLIK